jgi:aryl-alcohol dehydrogenase-like predicted oxidoreductase
MEPAPSVSDIARPMNTSPRPLGSSPVAVGPLGLGCWPLAGMTRAGISREAAVAAVRAAVAAGITHLDTAYCYGERGEADRAIGEALGWTTAATAAAHSRDSVVVAGKCGIHWEPDATADPPRRLQVDGRPERLRAEVDESLARLGTDHFDLLYLHCPDPTVPIEESAGELRRLMAAGKTRAVGLSNAGVDLLARFSAECPLAACQMHFNMLQREIEEAVLPWCRERNVAMVVYWPLMKGLLAGKMRRGQVFPASDSRHKYPLFNGEAFERNLDFVEALRPVAARLGVSLADLVLAWTVEQPGISSVLFGATSPGQVEANAQALACELDDAARRDIAAAITARGPVPRTRVT